MPITFPITFKLPPPWSGVHFELTDFAPINFLVGPNGSGKSRFAECLKNGLGVSRLLSTDRLTGMSKYPGLGIWGGYMDQGVDKNMFQRLRETSKNLGFGIDTILLLEERLDLRLRVEATLSHLFSRRILLEWDSGRLIPKMVFSGSQDTYRLDADECHGIKELFVLLSHLYNDQEKVLIIDEPELNLHPQYQAFFMQEVRKVAGDPDKQAGRKMVFLITHSPFILDFRGVDDIKSVISFNLDYREPVRLSRLDAGAASRIATLVPRLNVHHKQLFFSDNPIFVEGILDSQIIQAIQQSRNVSIPAAGSCIIECGGCDEVNKYLELCRALNKSAYFIYDLDSLFTGSLRACLGKDLQIQSFLATLGVTSDFARYCGELERLLTESIALIRKHDKLPNELAPLRDYIERIANDGQLGREQLARARVAVLTTLSRHRAPLAAVASDAIASEIEGRVTQIRNALKERNILLLPGGALEHYLPSYSGDPFELADDAKRLAVEREIELLANGITESELKARYSDLYEAICMLPAKPGANVDALLMEYLSDYVHELQSAIVSHPEWNDEQLRRQLSQKLTGADTLFRLAGVERRDQRSFVARLIVLDRLGGPQRRVTITDQTNAGMRQFVLEPQDHQ